MNGQDGSRRIILGPLVAMLAALAALAALGGGHASAETKNVVVTHNEDIQICKKYGGTSKSVGTRVVECKNGRSPRHATLKRTCAKMSFLARDRATSAGASLSVVWWAPVHPRQLR